MATQSPFSWLKDFFQNVGTRFEPPAWVVDEAQRRVLLLLNHVLMQEPEAMSRLKRHNGGVVLLQWRGWSFKVRTTPAGLLDRPPAEVPADLTLALIEPSPLALVQTALRGEKSALRIEGDVQLAAEINWLADHLRWDVEEDLARIVGDASANAMVQNLRRVIVSLRDFVASRQRGAQSGAPE